MSSRYKITVVTAYFGNFPNFYPLYLKTLAANPDVDFLLFTDNTLAAPPANLRVIRTTLAEVEQWAKQNTGHPEAVISTPYKLCDYKPMYGQIFREYLHGCDFWGHSDIDLLYGNLRRFWPDHVLEQYDKIGYLGHLTLYRNTPENNRRWELPGGKFPLELVLTRPQSFAWDEFNGMYRIYENNNIPFYKEVHYLDLCRPARRFCLRNRKNPKYPRNPDDHPYQIFYWQNGEIFRTWFSGNEVHTEPFQYIHFIGRKFPDLGFSPEDYPIFMCTPDGFVPLAELTLTRDLVKKYNPYPRRIREYLEIWIAHKREKYCKKQADKIPPKEWRIGM